MLVRVCLPVCPVGPVSVGWLVLVRVCLPMCPVGSVG